eukprot:scaffold10550_cov271-Chaetoceros_neogracile.AAC.13
MKGAMAISSVKNKASSMLNGLDKPEKKKEVIENPETMKEMNQVQEAEGGTGKEEGDSEGKVGC